MNYYVDYENVVCSGLVGIDKLTSNDTVNIYYSNDPNVDMETVIRIRNSKANIVFLKLCNSIKQMNRSNALDIVLSNDIVQSIISLRTKDICIISKDKDYDMLISELKSKHSGLNITRAASIASSSQKAAASKIEKQTSKSLKIDSAALNKLFSSELKKYAGNKNDIVNIVSTSHTRCEVNNRINQKYNNSQSRVIMAALKPIIKNLPGR